MVPAPGDVQSRFRLRLRGRNSDRDLLGLGCFGEHRDRDVPGVGDADDDPDLTGLK